jgi:hypothetical protein
MKDELDLRDDGLSWDENDDDDVDRKVVWIAWVIFYKRERMNRRELYENGEVICRIFFDMLYNDSDAGWSIGYVVKKKCRMWGDNVSFLVILFHG